MRTLHLVACGAAKLPHAAPARELYTGDLFAKSRAYVEALGGPWFILSAKHGLVHPDTELEPYDQCLDTMTLVQQNEWARGVAAELEKLGWQDDADESDFPLIVFLAGRTYRSFLAEHLSRRACIHAPMAGLGIGQQKAWLMEALAEHYSRHPQPGTLAAARMELNVAVDDMARAIASTRAGRLVLRTMLALSREGRGRL